MIDLTLIHWNIDLVVVLFIISIFKFLCLVHSRIGIFFICSTSTCFCTSQIVSSAGTSSGAFAYSTSTPNKLDHRLWSYCNVWQDRYWNFICITQVTILAWTGLEYLDFPQGLDSKHMLACAPGVWWYHAPEVGGFCLSPGWLLLKHFHQMCWPVGLFVCVCVCEGACTKTSHSLKQHQQKAFLQFQVDLVLRVLLVLLQWRPWSLLA